MEISPINFLESYSVDGHTINYTNFVEISQGGPEVAAMSIDGKLLGQSGDYFGGPPFFYHGKMFVPLLKKGLLRRYFKICLVKLSDGSIKEIGNKEELALITNVDDTSVYFFNDSPNTKLKSIRWN